METEQVAVAAEGGVGFHRTLPLLREHQHMIAARAWRRVRSVKARIGGHHDHPVSQCPLPLGPNSRKGRSCR